MDAEMTNVASRPRCSNATHCLSIARLALWPGRATDLTRSLVARLRVLPLIFAIATLSATTPIELSAQVGPDVNTNTDVDTTGQSEAEQRLRELTGGDSVPAIANPLILSRMLVPGEGLQILPLGTPFSQVRLEFGAPLEEKTTGLLGSTQNWFYTADDGTDIILSGEELVEEISVRGPANSTFMTREGLSFGTAAPDITVYYGVPDNSNQDEEFDYPQQGIRFGIEGGRVDYIVLSPPVVD